MLTRRSVGSTAAVLGLATTVVVVGAPPATAATLQCGDTITQSTVLTVDLVCTGDRGLVIGANNVTLDLKGHTITGPGIYSGETYGISIPVDISGATVLNGTVTNFRYGVRADTTQGATLTRLNAHHNLRGFDLANGAGLTVTQNTLADNDLDGIRVGGSDDTVISQNVVRDNVFGIHVTDYAGDVTVTRNTVTGSRDFGLKASGGAFDTIFSRNTVSGSRDYGIEAELGSINTVVSQNTVYWNGIHGVYATGSSTLTKNSAYENGQLGIFATGAVTDGGGNKAWDNGDFRQCVGVICSAP